MTQKEINLPKIASLIKGIEGIKNEIAVIIVANIKSEDGLKNDYAHHSLTTEFFAEREYEEIITGFRDNGFYTKFFQDEISFIRWVIEGGFDKLPKKFKSVYNAANGGKGPGKKSLIPSFCNLMNIPINSSNAYVVSLCRHKYHYNSILNFNNIPTARAWYFHKEYKWLLNNRPKSGTLIITKPTYESASVGIDEQSIFEYQTNKDEKIEALSDLYNQPITVQEFIQGYEVEVPVIIHNNRPFTLEPIGLALNNIKLLEKKILTYDIVYNDQYTFYKYVEFDLAHRHKILNLAETAACVIGTEGFGRIDFRITPSGDPYIIDVSTYPHIIKHSSFWYLFKENDFKYSDIFALMLSLTAARYKWQ